jgi:hypothetical protein
MRGDESILIESSGGKASREKRKEKDKIWGPVGKTQGLIGDI